MAQGDGMKLCYHRSWDVVLDEIDFHRRYWL